MKTKDILKDALKEFDGTLIVVSHDRYFLDGLVDKVYEFGGGKVKEFLGGIYDFLQYKNMGSLNELEKDNKGTSNETLSQNKTVNVSDAQNQQLEGKISYAAQKKREKLIRKSEKEVSKYEAEIEKFENKIQEIEQKLATQTEYDASIYEEHDYYDILFPLRF